MSALPYSREEIEKLRSYDMTTTGDDPHGRWLATVDSQAAEIAALQSQAAALREDGERLSGVLRATKAVLEHALATHRSDGYAERFGVHLSLTSSAIANIESALAAKEV